MRPPRERDHTTSRKNGRRDRPRPGAPGREHDGAGKRRRRRRGGPRRDAGHGADARGPVNAREHRGGPPRRGDTRPHARPPHGTRPAGEHRPIPRRAGTRRSETSPFRDLLRELQGRVSVDPFVRLRFETRPDSTSMRALDLVTPIGKGQRCLIVSPPKAGKTTLLIEVARAVAENHPEVDVFALLVDERPEEVTGFRRGVAAEVMAASSDMSAPEHIEIAERCLTRALERVLAGRDVMILLDSITRLARAYNAVTEGVGRTLSGGLDAATMHTPRQFFGAARKIEDGGSLTILGTALIDTGSRMDQVIFEEFKGTGNTELVLSRQLFEQRVFPCIDIAKSGTRKEEKLYPAERVEQLQLLRRALVRLERAQAMRKLLELLGRYRTNEDLLEAVGAALSQ